MREGFREQSWKGSSRPSLFADANRISADRARGIGVYVPRSESIGTLDYMGLFRYYCVLLTPHYTITIRRGPGRKVI